MKEKEILSTRDDSTLIFTLLNCEGVKQDALISNISKIEQLF